MLLPQPDSPTTASVRPLVEGEADAAQRLDLARRLEQPAADQVAALEALGRDDALGHVHAASPGWPGWFSGTPPVSG